MTDITEKLSPIIDHIKAGKKITFFQGAGVSTGAGIPDFRSPETGLYSNLSKLNLPYAEAVFDIDYFKKNPKAFYTLADELYPGKFQPTSFHYFIRLVQDKKLLKRVYTQNIDTLERVAGIEDEYIVEAHGSFARNHCIRCKHEMSVKDVREKMKKKEIPRCEKCKGYVKPDITFFGESLPVRFFGAWEEDSEEVEFAIVAGTSLTVYPFASLPSELSSSTPRVLINKEIVGDFAHDNSNDTIILQDCDTVAEKLVDLLGWTDEFQKLKSSSYSFGYDKEDEVEKITQDMKKVLKEEDEAEEQKQGEEVQKEDNDRVQQTPTSREPEDRSEKEDTPQQADEEKDSITSKLLSKLGNLKI